MSISQMHEYWPKRLYHSTDFTAQSAPAAAAAAAAAADPEDFADEFDCTRLKRLQSADAEDGWKAELQRYLSDPGADLKRDTDTVKWWAVRTYIIILLHC